MGMGGVTILSVFIVIVLYVFRTYISINAIAVLYKFITKLMLHVCNLQSQY